MSQTANLLKKITEALKEDSSLIDDMDVVYQFNLKGDYPTTYQLLLRGKGSYVVEGEAIEADCILFMKEEHFLQLATGKLTGTKALFTGKLKMEGNVKLALKLERILSAYNQNKTV